MVGTVDILGVCGSLRAASLKSIQLRVARRLAPPQVRLNLYPSIGDLPLFNPDLEACLPAPRSRPKRVVAPRPKGAMPQRRCGARRFGALIALRMNSMNTRTFTGT